MWFYCSKKQSDERYGIICPWEVTLNKGQITQFFLKCFWNGVNLPTLKIGTKYIKKRICTVEEAKVEF